MVLSSQMRPSVDRRFMGSRSRRRRRRPWKAVVAVGGLVAVAVIFLAFPGSDDEAVDARPLDHEAAYADQTEGESSSPQSLDVASSGDSTAVGVNRRPPEPPAIMRFGEDASPLEAITAIAPLSRSNDTTGNRAASTNRQATGSAPAQTGGSVPIPAATSSSSNAAIQRGIALLREERLVEGRAALSALLTDPNSRLSARDAQTVRDILSQLNEDMVFGSRIVPGDPLVDVHTVQQGDLTSRIARRHDLTHDFVGRVNGIHPDRIRIGQKLKVIRGPFHAVVSKRNYRLDLYLNDDAGRPIFIRSYPVGLGEDDSTPLGSWIVPTAGKAKDPSWTDPRSGTFYASNHPDNPLGGYWMRLEGTDDNTRGKTGYGIHGTDEPNSIGQQMSLGCIRMRDGDIQEMFTLLVEGKSTVHIVE